MIQHVMHNVRYLAAKLTPRGAMDVDDLVQVATISLMRLMPKFDASRASWRTFACWRAHHAMIDELRRLDHIPRSARLRGQLDGRPLPAIVSLDALSEEGARPDPVHAADPIDPEADSAFWGRIRVLLNTREWEVVDRRFRRSQPLHEIARAMGLSESRACQISAKAMKKLRRELPQERGAE